MASDSKNGLLFILEGLAGLLGGRTVLEAARWQQGRIVRDVEAESNTRRKKKPNETPFLVKIDVDRVDLRRLMNVKHSNLYPLRYPDEAGRQLNSGG
ncbi:hypothetical protein NECAME_07109 [Necator americanus]|uniref:Uncharacterized protein n=1 Tax=Necator americanus TaxID=51031 RepID=W2TQC8_NECAM|nr:hypothetical protein NECAME_07109 [Necator americanus]ETN84013.1 hypothetical protein NECAME_07109 [Necator americanus]